MECIFNNPFFNNDNKILINGNYKSINEISLNEIYNNFSKIYILCLKDNCEIDDRIYKDNLCLEDLEYIRNNMLIFRSNLKLLKNDVHKSQVVLIDDYYLNKINSNNYDEINLLLPLINLSETNYKKYMKQYINDIKIDDYLSIKSINNFYNNNNESNKYYLSKLLMNMDTTDYWVKMNKLNLTGKFIEREFNLTLSDKIKDIKLRKLLNNLNDIPKEGDNYLSYIYRNDVHVDISLVLKKNGYNLYYLDNNLDLTTEMLNNVIDDLNNDYEIYNLIVSLLISKKYCHLILKNIKLLNKFDYIIEKYNSAIKYAMCYGWLCMYSEECIKKTYINEEDRFVFKINEAHNLPKFVFKINELRSNPYFSFLVSEDIVNLKSNIMGVNIENMRLGVCNLLEFKRRSNIFISGNENINILEGVDMSNLGLTGSIIPACVTLFNPLQTKFETLGRYYDEYYCNSDIDVICNLESNNEFIERVYKFFNSVDSNYKKLFIDSLDINAYKNTVIVVNDIFINNNIVSSDLSYDYILENLDDLSVKRLFYKRYLSEKIKDNEKYFNNKKWLDDRYNILFKIELLENLRIVFIKSGSEYNEKFNFSNEMFLFNESIKFKIFGSKLNHNFEIFKTKYPVSFFSVISKFHLPCVRGYYDGNDVYLLPSCISAANTLINLDYKYFAGTVDPIEIINKYRMRGYSTILNDSEKIKFIKYILSLDRTSLMYNNPSIRKQKEIDSMLGYFDVNDKFFNPRDILSEYYLNNKPVDLNYINVKVDSKWRNDFNQFLDDDIENPDLLKLLDLNFVDLNGYIKPVKKWYFEALFDVKKN
jgi:hypothetical protein